MIEFAFPYALLLLPAPWLVWRFFPPYRQNVTSLRFPFFRRITDAAGSEPRPGSVIVDVAVDQGGCVETIKPTTHEDPVYEVDGVVHYAVANMPGAVPRTSTLALTNATLPYALQLAAKGWKQACAEDASLAAGINVIHGKVTYAGVAEAFDMPWEPVDRHLVPDRIA